MALDLRNRSAPGQVSDSPELAGARGRSAVDWGCGAQYVLGEFAGDAAELDKVVRAVPELAGAERRCPVTSA
ncbi:hypothetical protein [Sorangium sp. So ce1389]|uniref:hypothetical protein n=1 Tax=Sorangium sp. So ce1389 TaxID=3133336 RepID=UPI003F6136E0